MLKGKRILVTGASGVIGLELVKQLEQLGALVISVDKRTLPLDNIPNNIYHVQADLVKGIPRTLQEYKPHIVFHLAAVFERSDEDAGYWKENFNNNVLLSHNLLQAMVEIGTVEKFIFASSYLIYDPTQYANRTSVRYLKESDLLYPRNLVGAAKLFFEQELAFVYHADRAFETLSARIYRVYGKGSRDVISRFIRAALREETLDVYSPKNTFDFIYAKDVAVGLILLASAEEARYMSSVNLGTGKPHSITDVIAVLSEFLPDLSVTFRSDKVFTPEQSAANTGRLDYLTKWLPQTSLRQGIKEIVTYERSRL